MKTLQFLGSYNKEFNRAEYSETILERNDGRDNATLQHEIAVVNERLQTLEMLWEKGCSA